MGQIGDASAVPWGTQQCVGGAQRAGHPPQCSLGQDLVEQSLGLALLLQVGLSSLLHQLLQVVGVLLHARQQVVQDVAAALPAGRG